MQDAHDCDACKTIEGSKLQSSKDQPLWINCSGEQGYDVAHAKDKKRILYEPLFMGHSSGGPGRGERAHLDCIGGG